MKLKNVLLVVNDMEKSVDFYKTLFGLEVILNSNGNVIMTEGLVLQDRKIWEKTIGKEVITRNHSGELYFVENELEDFMKKLEQYPESIEYVTPLTKQNWGQEVIRFYDLDGNLIEVGTQK